MNTIRIRNATPADYFLIRDIAGKTWPETFGDILSGEQIAYMLEMMYSLPSLTGQVEKQGHQFLLAFRGTSCTGFASYETGYRGLLITKIHKIYVLTSSQGKGIGTRLMAAITAAAEQHGNRILSLNVNRNNPSIRFYLRLGFEIVAEENIPIGQGFLMEDFVMEKKLPLKK